MNNEWLQNLKVGDEVYISQDYNEPPRHAIVLRTTEKQIIVKEKANSGGEYESRFWKKNSKEVSSDSWHSHFLLEPSPKIREEVEVSRLKNQAQILRNKLSIPQTKPELIDFIEKLSSLVKEVKQ
jgi:hypothetical protein